MDEVPYRNLSKKTFDLRGCIRYLWSKCVVIVLCGLLSGMIASIALCIIPPKYEATVKLYILENNGSGITLSALQSGSLLMADYREAFKTWEVHENVRSQLGLDMTYQEMQEMLTVQIPDGSRLLYISVRHSDPVFAADLANAYAKAGYAFITQSLHGLEPDVFSNALIPSETVGLSVGGWIALALVAGMLLATGGYTLFFCLDQKIRVPEELQIASGLPVLAVFPRRKAAEITVEEKEAACLLASRMRNNKCVLVTAPSTGEGVSFVCADLVQAMAALHRKVLWIHIEHKPFWNHAEGSQLGDYLEGRCGWSRLVQPYEGGALLSITGTEDELPSQLFHPKMSALMEKLRSEYDTILVDALPMDQRADGSAFVSDCDGILLVAGCGQSNFETVRQYVDCLAEAKCPVIGAVLNRACNGQSVSVKHTVKTMKAGIEL